MVYGHGPGPAPLAQARPSASAATRSSWRAEPQVNERRNVPIVDGAKTRWPRTCPVDPARSLSQSSIQLPPASAEATSVIALSPGRVAEIDELIHQLAQSQPDRERGRQQQPGVSDQALVVESDLDLVRVVGSH
jgi:hypothetical protein